MLGNHIEVAVRVRPLLPTDHPNERIIIETIPRTNQVVIKCRECFTVDAALPIGCSQSQLFNLTVNPLIEYVLEGYDISVIAYGQSRSGKTYTTVGPGLHCAYSETEYGIIPRATREIFNRVTQRPERRYKVKITFIEIIGEEIRDLLNTSHFSRNIILGEGEHGKPIIVGAEEIECHNISEVFNWLQIGINNKYCSTMGLYPNRSHSVFILALEQLKSLDGAVYTVNSKAQFVDLAGSERTILVNDGMHLVAEPMQLDTGLIALEKVVLTVTEPHSIITRIPYQLSVLTKVLQNAIGGNGTTLVLCCLSPASLDCDESLNSLKFATQLRKIVNVPMMNVSSPPMMLETITCTGSEEPCTEDIYDAVDSEERSTNADTFGLQFATSLWLTLISNAEDLFNKLVAKKCLSRDEKEKIERWLCLKQECEECIGSDDAASYRGYEGRILERIDELTESEQKTDSSTDSESSQPQSSYSRTKDDGTEYESETETEQELQLPDFLERLDELMQEFRRKTDKMVQEMVNYSVSKPNFGTGASKDAVLKQLDGANDETEPSHTVSAFANCKNLGSRRKSIHPGTDLINVEVGVSHPSRSVSTQADGLPETETVIPKLFKVDKTVGTRENVCTQIGTEPLKDSLLDSSNFSISPIPVAYKELKLLSAESEARQIQMQQILIDLEGAHKRIEDLQRTIQIKEQFISEMIRNNDTRVSAKQRFQRRRSKLEEEYYKTRTHLAQAENALLTAAEDESATESRLRYEKEIGKYKNRAIHYEKRLKDIEIVKKIAGDSAKKVLELEASLQTSRKQMDRLQKQLKKEEEHKQCLEKELLQDQRKIRELEQKYNLQTSKLNERDTGEEERMKWIQKEEQRLTNMRESSERLQEQILQQQSILDKREAFLKEKLSQENFKTKSIMEVSARISRLKQVLKEKSTDLEKAEDPDERLALRQEIENLRRTRDCLLDQRSGLDKKFQKEKILTKMEERKFLECDEAIEAIDAAIEYKNELICGRKGQGLDSSTVHLEKEEELLLARLMKLSPMEMRTLLYKYFQKVIDLRESGRKMEAQIAELDQQTEVQAWKIQALSNALQQASIEMERRLVMQQKEDQEKLHLMLKHFAEESSGGSSGAEAVAYYNAEKEAELSHYKRDNRILKKRLQELESVLKTDGKAWVRRNQSVSPVAIPRRNLRQLQGSGSPPTTKVTRQKNKLIIQQQNSKKPSKI